LTIFRRQLSGARNHDTLSQQMIPKKKKKKIPHRPRSVAWELIPFTAL